MPLETHLLPAFSKQDFARQSNICAHNFLKQKKQENPPSCQLSSSSNQLRDLAALYCYSLLCHQPKTRQSQQYEFMEELYFGNPNKDNIMTVSYQFTYFDVIETLINDQYKADQLVNTLEDDGSGAAAIASDETDVVVRSMWYPKAFMAFLYFGPLARNKDAERELEFFMATSAPKEKKREYRRAADREA